MRDFLGHPIRARIKGTSAQRPSAVSKKPHFYPPVQNVYNGQQPVSTAALAREEGGRYMCIHVSGREGHCFCENCGER